MILGSNAAGDGNSTTALSTGAPTPGTLLVLFACGNADFTTPTDNGANTGWHAVSNNLGPYQYLWYRASTAADATPPGGTLTVNVNLVAAASHICSLQLFADVDATLMDSQKAAVVGSAGTSSPATSALHLTAPALVVGFSGNRGATTSTGMAQLGSWSNHAVDQTPYVSGSAWGHQGSDAEISGFLSWHWTNAGLGSYNTQVSGWTNAQADRNTILACFPARAPAFTNQLNGQASGASVSLGGAFQAFMDVTAGSLVVAYLNASASSGGFTASAGWALQAQDFNFGTSAVFTKTADASGISSADTFTTTTGPVNILVVAFVNAGNVSGSTGVDTLVIHADSTLTNARTLPSVTATAAGDVDLLVWNDATVHPAGYAPVGNGSNWPAPYYAKLTAPGPTPAVSGSNLPGSPFGYAAFRTLILGDPTSGGGGAGGTFAAVALGPLAVAVGSGGSPPTVITSTGITGAAVLNIGPLAVVTHSTFETKTATGTVALGPLIVAAVSGQVGPGVFPVPGFRGRWRLTLHTRAFAPATLASTMIAELADAYARQLVQAWNTPATLTFSLDGRSQSAALVAELLHDVVAWRWDDQTGREQAVFRGIIAQSQDTLDAESHTVTYTCHDYGALLARRLLTATYTVTGRDQDLIVADLLSAATAARTSSGVSLTPAAYLPLSLFPATASGALRGLSGQLRDRTYYGSQNIGDAVTALAQVIGGFDYDVQPSSVAATDSLRVFYPAQGVTRNDVTLQYGSTVAGVTRTVDSSTYANYVRVLGNNQSANPTPQLYAEAWDPTAASITPTPVGLWMDADDASDATIQATLNDKAAGDLNLAVSFDPAYTLTLTPDAYTWGHPNMGDIVPLVVQSGRLNVTSAIRVLGITYAIGDDGQEDVSLACGRVTTSLAKLFKKADRDTKALARR